MRNNHISLAIMTALFLLVAGVSFALGPQQRGTEQKTAPPAETPQQQEEPVKKEEEKPADAEDPNAPKRFVPTQKTSADNSATFPVDI